MARLKLGHTGSTNFEMFESLELLVLGIHGKLCFWKALMVASRQDLRLEEFNFEELIDRARLDLAKRNFRRFKNLLRSLRRGQNTHVPRSYEPLHDLEIECKPYCCASAEEAFGDVVKCVGDIGTLRSCKDCD